MIYDLLRSMIKTGVGKKTDDTGVIRRAIVKWLGIEQQVESLVPFGTFGNPQDGVQYLLLKRRCNEANVAGIACDPANRIKKDTKPGEFGVGNPITKSNMYFKENGDVVIEIPKGNVVADADEIILNSGSKGVARLDDETLVNGVTDADMVTWMALVNTFISACTDPVAMATANGVYTTAIGVLGGVPTTITGKISSASTTVKAG